MSTYKENSQLKYQMRLPSDPVKIEELFDNFPVHGVYALQHVPSDKFYVGETTNLVRRFYSHLYGTILSIDPEPNNWKVYVLEVLGYNSSKTERLDREAFWSKYYDSFNSGLNQSRDGSGYDCNRGTIWINNGVESKRILESEMHLYPGYEVGFLCNNIKDTYNVTKEGIDKRIKGHELQKYLEDGWEEGRTFISTPLPDGYYGYDPKRHKTYMNNGKVNIYITDTWYHYWLERGFTPGKKNDKYLTVTNGVDEVSIYHHELDEYLKNGYVNKYLVEWHDATEHTEYDESLVPERAKCAWVTKKGVDSRIEEARLQEYLDDNWEQGRSLIVARTADGSYSADRYAVGVKKGDEEFRVTHYYLPYWLEQGYEIYAGYNKRYVTNGTDEMILTNVSPLPEGYHEGSLAQDHYAEIEIMYNRITGK